MVSKKRRKSKKELRLVIGKQLRYVRRNISTIEKMLDEVEPNGVKLPLVHIAYTHVVQFFRIGMNTENRV